MGDTEETIADTPRLNDHDRDHEVINLENNDNLARRLNDHDRDPCCPVGEKAECLND